MPVPLISQKRIANAKKYAVSWMLVISVPFTVWQLIVTAANPDTLVILIFSPLLYLFAYDASWRYMAMGGVPTDTFFNVMKQKIEKRKKSKKNK